MADTKPVDRDAGKRRRLFIAAAALLTCRLFAGSRQAVAGTTLPQLLFTIHGARRMTRADSSGTSGFRGAERFTPLVFPVAVAAFARDIYIADAGSAHLYRYDHAQDAFALIRGVMVTPSTRLQVGIDGSLYVLDAIASLVLRFNRNGTCLSSLPPSRETSRYTDFDVDPVTGRIFAVDSAYRSVDVIEPTVGIAIEQFHIEEPGPFAISEHAIYLASASSGCVNVWVDGRLHRSLGAGQLFQPRALAVSGDWIYAIDGARNIVRVKENGVESISSAQLGLHAPESLTIARDILLVADGAGGRVAGYRLAKENGDTQLR